MEKELRIKKLREGLFLLDEAGEATGYLLVGEEKACLIDTMNGYNDLAKATASLTDKPVVVVNTHGHPDHIFGNIYFDKAFLHPADLKLADMFLNDPEFQAIIKKEGLTIPPFEAIQEGDVIDLGGKTLKVYDLPGHTPGGIVLLCPEEKVLFTGDAINHHLWLQLEGCLPMAECRKNLERLRFLMDEAEYILHGHAGDFDDISLIGYLIEGMKEIEAGDNSKDTPYTYFDGHAHATYHPFYADRSKRFSSKDSGIVYNA
ncbi:MAG: MBL fold metallo-hydrolase [Clostridiales bacterium]|nr:MBL fold metallo-hydrolase [Candidatus Blautia equi]